MKCGLKLMSISFLFLSVFSSLSYADMNGTNSASMRGRGRQGGGPRMEQAAQPKFEFDDKSTLRQILTYDKELELTDAQIEAIRKIRSDSINDAKKKYEVLSAAQKDLADSVNQVKPDFAAARAKIKEITEIAIGIQTETVDAYEKAFSTLTNEQKEKLFIIRAKLNADNPERNGQNPERGDVEKSQ